MKRALQGKAPAHDNHRLLLYHDYHTIDIIAHHYFLLYNELSFLQAD